MEKYECFECGSEITDGVCTHCEALFGKSPTSGSADDVERLEAGLRDIHDRLTGTRGNPKWVVGHIENLLAGRKHCDWE